MKNRKGGINVGNYRITLKPLGIAVLCIIVLAIIGGVLYLLRDTIFAGNDDVVTAGTLPVATPVATATPSAEEIIVPVTPTPVATATPTPTPVPTPTPEPTPRAATLRFIGEIIIDENILSAALQSDGSYSFADMFSMVAVAVGDADYTIANVEGSMGGIGNGYSGKGSYNSPEVLITDLKDIGVDMLTLANDHALDAGFEGLLNTIAFCEDAGMEYVGAATTPEEHDTPKIIDINGINFCFLNYTTTLNDKEDNTSKDAVEYGVNLAAKSDSKADAAAAREAGADIVIAIVSWSKDGETDIDGTQRKIAAYLLESDVDAIIGYGPRNTQAIMWLDNTDEDGNVTDSTLCVRSIGTFLSDSTKPRMDWGIILEFSVAEQEDGSFKIDTPTSIPTYVWQFTEEGKDFYRVLACGEWPEEKPEGMSDEDYARLTKIWNDVGDIVTEVSEISAN